MSGSTAIAGQTPWQDPRSGGVSVLLSWSDPSGAARIASAGTDGQILIWDPDTRAPVGSPLTGHTGTVSTLVTWTSSDRTFLASSGEDGSIRIWDAQTGEAIGAPLLGSTGLVPAVAIWVASDGRARLSSGSLDGTVRAWDPQTGTAEPMVLTGHTSWVRAMSSWVSADGRARLATADVEGVIRVWDPETGDLIGSPATGHTGAVWALTSWNSRTGRRLASGGIDGTIRVWAPEQGKAIGPPITGHDGWVSALTTWATPDQGVRLLSGGHDGSVRMWDPEQGTALGSPMVGHSGSVTALTTWIEPSGTARLASAGDDGTIQIWNPDEGTAEGSPLVGHTAGVWALAQWADETGATHLASAGDDGVIHVFNADIGTPLFTLSGHSGPVWALATWRTRTGETRLASGGDDGDLRIWDSAGYELVVFIDDIDRCRAGTTAQVFEAVNLFLSGFVGNGTFRARFVIGLDPEIVADHLDRAQAGTAGSRSGRRGDDPSAGWAFLRKLIQLPVLVPRVSTEAIPRFVDHVTATRASAAGSSRIAPVLGAAPDLPAGSGSGSDPSHPPIVADPPSLPIEVAAWRTLERHPSVRDAVVHSLLRQPERSIRESKRLLNVWQLYERVLAIEAPVSTADALVRSRHLIALSEIVTRWPALLTALCRDADNRFGLTVMAESALDDAAWNSALTLLGLDLPCHQPALTNLRTLLLEHDGVAAAALGDQLW